MTLTEAELARLDGVAEKASTATTAWFDYIAAFDPPTTRALIRELREARAAEDLMADAFNAYLHFVAGLKFLPAEWPDSETLIKGFEWLNTERDRILKEHPQWRWSGGDALPALQNSLTTLRKERDSLRTALLDLAGALEKAAAFGPDHTQKSEYACWFCDMGGAGYSSKGDGYHDDTGSKGDYCAVLAAQETLAKHAALIAGLRGE
jgi:hypothetical protein